MLSLMTVSIALRIFTNNANLTENRDWLSTSFATQQFHKTALIAAEKEFLRRPKLQLGRPSHQKHSHKVENYFSDDKMFNCLIYKLSKKDQNSWKRSLVHRVRLARLFGFRFSGKKGLQKVNFTMLKLFHYRVSYVSFSMILTNNNDSSQKYK